MWLIHGYSYLLKILVSLQFLQKEACIARSLPKSSPYYLSFRCTQKPLLSLSTITRNQPLHTLLFSIGRKFLTKYISEDASLTHKTFPLCHVPRRLKSDPQDMRPRQWTLVCRSSALPCDIVWCLHVSVPTAPLELVPQSWVHLCQPGHPQPLQPRALFSCPVFLAVFLFFWDWVSLSLLLLDLSLHIRFLFASV